MQDSLTQTYYFSLVFNVYGIVKLVTSFKLRENLLGFYIKFLFTNLNINIPNSIYIDTNALYFSKTK